MTHVPYAPLLTPAATWLRPFVAAEGGDAVLLVSLTTAPLPKQEQRHRAPVDVAFVVDRSGSMGGQKLALAKDAVRVAAKRLLPTDRLALVTYDHEVEVPVPLSGASAATLANLGQALAAVDARGSTLLSGGWLTGCAQLADAAPTVQAGTTGPDTRERVRRTMLLTDGLANVGVVDPTELAGHAHELRARGITTTTLGVGVDFDGPLLSQLAEAGGGNYAFIEHPAQLPHVFACELDELVTITAHGVSVSLSLPDGVQATLLNPYPTERGGGSLHVSVGDLPGGTTVDLVFVLTAGAGAVGHAYLVSTATSWRDADGRQHRHDTATPALVTIPLAEMLLRPVDTRAAEADAIQRTAALQRQAARDAQAGRFADVRASYAQMHDVLAAAPVSAALNDLRVETASDAAKLALADRPAAFAPDVASRGFARGRRSARFDDSRDGQ